MSTLSKKEKELQVSVNLAYKDIQNIQLYMNVLQGNLLLDLSKKEREENESELADQKVRLVMAQNTLDEALDNMLGIHEEEEEEPHWIVKPNLWSMLGM